MKPIIGIVGLGIMGSAMAEALIDGGCRVVGYDVQAKPRERWKSAGGRCLSSCAAVASRADVLITSLPSVAALDDVFEKIEPVCARKRKSQPNLIVIETSTLPIIDKKRVMRRVKRGVTVLDCPISGTARRMKEGGWTIFVSGSKNVCKSVSAILVFLPAMLRMSVPSAMAVK